jgi:uncharacterized membrane protein YphA (DoxX/SURF4 family)
MSKLPLIARVLLGLVFFAAGLGGLLTKPPADLTGNIKLFIDGMMATTYFLPFLKITETICGFLLLSGMFVPLVLVILAPILLNIFLIHAFLAPSGLPLAIILGCLEIYLAFFAKPYRDVIRSLFRRV